MSTIPQNDELLKNLFELMGYQRELANQQPVYERLEMLFLSELFVFGRHTVTQLLMSLGLKEYSTDSFSKYKQLYCSFLLQLH